jgi:hypothetical protein
MKMKYSCRELAMVLRKLKRTNEDGNRTSKRFTGKRQEAKEEVTVDDHCEFEDDTFFDAPVSSDVRDVIPSDDEAEDDGLEMDVSPTPKKRGLQEYRPMSLNQADTRGLISFMARQMNFPPEYDMQSGLPNWRGGKGGTIDAITKLLYISYSPNTVHPVLRRTHKALMDGALSDFDARERGVTKGREDAMEEYEIMLAIRNLRDGYGYDLTLMVANELRFAMTPPRPEISEPAMRRHCKSWGLKCHRRQS